MKVVVSACLMGRNCKYNGGCNRNDALIEALGRHTVVEVCPEVAGGLPTPRPASEIRGNRVVNTKGEDVTDAFAKGAQRCAAQCEGVDLAIMQPRSPSCGARAVYDGTFSKTLVPGQGVFARLLTELGVQAIDADDPALASIL